MTCTQAYSGRRFCSAGQLKKNNVFLASSHRNRAGHGPHYSGRWEVGGSFLPQPPSAQQADNLDPGHEPSILLPGWGRGSISGAILAAKSPWHSLPLGEVEWLREFKPCLLDTRALSSASLSIAGPCLVSCNMETSKQRRKEQMRQDPAWRVLCQPGISFPAHPVAKQRLRWCPSGSLSAATPTGSPGSRAC